MFFRAVKYIGLFIILISVEMVVYLGKTISLHFKSLFFPMMAVKLDKLLCFNLLQLIAVTALCVLGLGANIMLAQ